MNLPLENISKLYDLKLTLIEKVSSGYLSENYILSNGHKYFLKKHRHIQRSQVEEVMSAERYFADGGVPVILPLATVNDEYFFEFEGGYFSLYPFVNGRHIERGTLSEAAAVSLGSTLGNLHKCGKESTLPITEQFNGWDKDKFLTKAAAIEAKIAKIETPSEFDALILKSLELKKRCVLANTVTYEQLSLRNKNLIHGDYFCNNVFFGKNDKVSYVFDFEKVQYAAAPYEMFRSLFVSFFSIPTQENLALAKKYVDAYLAVFPVSELMLKESLQAAYLKQIHSIWIEEEHYLKNSTRADDLLPSQYALNEYYVSNKVEIEMYLLK